MDTRKQKILEIPMTTWVIQRIEALTARDGQDPADGDEPLFIERFSNNNYFDVAFHENGIAGVVQDYDK